MATVRQYLKSEAAVSTNPPPPPSPSLVLNPEDYYFSDRVQNSNYNIYLDGGCSTTATGFPIPYTIKLTDRGAGVTTVRVYWRQALNPVGTWDPSLLTGPFTLLNTVTVPSCPSSITVGDITVTQINVLTQILITDLSDNVLSYWYSLGYPSNCSPFNDICTLSDPPAYLTTCPYQGVINQTFDTTTIAHPLTFLFALPNPLIYLGQGQISCPNPLVSPSPTPSLTPTPSPAYYYNANEFSCNVSLGTCGSYLGVKTIYSGNNSLTLNSFYTASTSRIYQPVTIATGVNPSTAIRVDSRPYNSCNQACSIPSCYSGSIVNYSSGGWITYKSCAGNTTYLQLSNSGSYTIGSCHVCNSITGSTGPGASGSAATITSITCGYECYIQPSPSLSPTPTLTPTKTPSLTPSKTPSITPTPTPSVSPSIAVSPSPSAPPPISPSCTCPAGYTGSYDGTTCISSSTSYPNSYIIASGDRIDWGGASFVWGKNGVRIYNGYDSSGNATNNYTYQTPQSNLNVWDSIWPTLPNTTITSDIFWANRLNTNGIWVDRNPYWPGPPGGDPPYPNYREICSVLYIPTAGTYYVGLAGDNRPVLKIDGVTVVDKGCCSLENFNYWHIYPISLSAGPHLIEVRNWNYTGSVGVAPNNYSIGVFACEIYNNTPSQLLNATSDSNINTIFSTGEYCKARQTVYPALQASPYPGNIGGYSTTAFNGPLYPNGPKAGFTFCNNSYCPPGFMLDASDQYNPICRKFDYITAPCNPGPSPSISVSPTATPSISATPSVTPSVSGTPCPTVSVTQTPTVTPTLSPSPPTCNCENGTIINNNLYFYYDCTGSYQSGSNALNTPICFNTVLDYSKNVVTNGTSCCTTPPSVTPSPTTTPSTSTTPSVTPTVSKTPSVTPSKTPSVSATPSVTPTVSKTPSVTPSLTPSVTPSPSEFCVGNLVTNGQFTTNLNGWNSGSTANTSVSWINFNGSGQAVFVGSGSATLSQNVLSVGNYYNISFDAISDTYGGCTSSLFVYAGTATYGPITASGYLSNINIYLNCENNATFSIQSVADCESPQEHFIDNICVIDVS